MSAIIDYKNVEVLRKELLVLKNVNFQLEEGQFVYLIGRVGSGKSSLMKTMYAEVPIEMGEARIFDYDLSAIRRKDVGLSHDVRSRSSLRRGSYLRDRSSMVDVSY